MWRLKPDRAVRDGDCIEGHLRAADESGFHTRTTSSDAVPDSGHANAGSRNRVDTFDARLDNLDWDAELDHRTGAKSAARDDDAAPDKSGRTAGAVTARCRSRRFRHVDDYYRDACPKAVGRRAVLASPSSAPIQAQLPHCHLSLRSHSEE
jgi:hypothetical protein